MVPCPRALWILFLKGKAPDQLSFSVRVISSSVIVNDVASFNKDRLRILLGAEVSGLYILAMMRLSFVVTQIVTDWSIV
jgi:hypothetical protein